MLQAMESIRATWVRIWGPPNENATNLHNIRNKIPLNPWTAVSAWKLAPLSTELSRPFLYCLADNMISVLISNSFLTFYSFLRDMSIFFYIPVLLTVCQTIERGRRCTTGDLSFIYFPWLKYFGNISPTFRRNILRPSPKQAKDSLNLLLRSCLLLGGLQTWRQRL